MADSNNSRLKHPAGTGKITFGQREVRRCFGERGLFRKDDTLPKNIRDKLKQLEKAEKQKKS